ncbi:hypothetical protein GCM10009574_013730 [Streptomyces asiaticus]
MAQLDAAGPRCDPPSTDLLMGLPAFHTDDIGHHVSAETVTAAVRGARLGLSRQSPRAPRSSRPGRQATTEALTANYLFHDNDHVVWVRRTTNNTGRPMPGSASDSHFYRSAATRWMRLSPSSVQERTT